jgi:hypothetical protein
VPSVSTRSKTALSPGAGLAVSNNFSVRLGGDRGGSGDALEDGVEEFGAALFEIAGGIAEHCRQSSPRIRWVPSGGGAVVALRERLAADSKASAVVSCQVTTRKPAASSFARVTSVENRKLMPGSRGRCTVLVAELGFSASPRGTVVRLNAPKTPQSCGEGHRLTGGR